MKTLPPTHRLLLFSFSFFPQIHRVFGPKWLFPSLGTFILRSDFHLSVCICVSLHHMCVGVWKDQKRTSNSLEQEFQVLVSHLTWVMGIELCSLNSSKCLNY